MGRVRAGGLCPECGETEAIQDNGAEGPERAWLCEVCHMQWDAAFGETC